MPGEWLVQSITWWLAGIDHKEMQYSRAVNRPVKLSGGFEKMAGWLTESATSLLTPTSRVRNGLLPLTGPNHDIPNRYSGPNPLITQTGRWKRDTETLGSKRLTRAGARKMCVSLCGGEVREFAKVARRNLSRTSGFQRKKARRLASA